MNPAFIRARIAATENMISIYEDALIALGTDGVQEYRLDTGQTVTNVTKLDIGRLNSAVSSLYNRLSTLEARLNGSGTVIARPAF